MILRRMPVARTLSSVSVLAVALLTLSVRAVGQAPTPPPPKKPVPATPTTPAKPATTTTPAKPAGSTSTSGTPTKTGATTTTTTATHPGTTTTTTTHPGTTTTTGTHTTTTTTAGTHTTTPAAGTAHATPGGGAGGLHGATSGATPGHPAPATHGVAGVNHGNLAHAGPKGSIDRVGPHGEAVRMRANGRPSDVHRAGMDIHHNLAGGRRVEMERADHSRLYYERGRPGYIAHPYSFHGHDYYRRSYYYNGRAYDRFYNHYGYRGIYLDVYAPARFYGIGFYGWAYNPWVTPVPYAWGFAAAPWYGYYGAYFTPYPVYASPSLWLTDYLISASLQTAYDAHLAAQEQAEMAGTAPPAPLTPETKQYIADEVRRQVALENAEAQANGRGADNDAASSSIARILTDGQPHVFVAGKEVDVVDAAGQECAVTDGDVLQLKVPPGPAATTANLVVLSSKGGVECPRMDVVSVGFEDLQDMQNHMRETIDQGLQELQAKQGQGGLPAAPASASAPPVTAMVAQGAPPPDPAGAQDLAAQAQQSEKAEQDALAATAGGPSDSPGAPAAPAGPPATISLGQSTDDVKGSLGQPTKIINLGAKTIYVYPDMKVTFNNGKVSDVE